MPTLKEFAEKTGLPRKRRWKDVYAQLSELVPTKPKAPTIIKVAPKVEEVARYMVRDFHDWTFNDVFPADAGMNRWSEQSVTGVADMCYTVIVEVG